MPSARTAALEAREAKGHLDPRQPDQGALIWIINQLMQIEHHEEKIMADLSGLSAALDKLGADVATAATDVENKLAELIADIAALQPGNVSQADLDALAAKAASVDDAVSALDAAATAATPPTPPTP